jgi:hypothetical protein
MVEQRRDRPDFVKVLDFGIAKILDSDMPGLTRADVVCGTPQYMAPEQATGTQLDARCDLYAVGVILYQMATGHLPFDGQNSMEVLTKHVNDPPIPPRQRQPDAPISEAMESLILRALEKDPVLRPQTAEAFRQLLLEVPKRRATGELIQGTPAALTPAGSGALASATAVHEGRRAFRAGSARQAPARRKRAVALVAGSGALLLLLAGGMMWRGREEPSAPPESIPPIPVMVSTLAGTPPTPPARRPRDPEKARELVQRASE